MPHAITDVTHGFTNTLPIWKYINAQIDIIDVVVTIIENMYMVESLVKTISTWYWETLDYLGHFTNMDK